MESETAAGEMTQAPVVRQLDFTINSKSMAVSNANGKGNLILPEHPQAQLESKLLALAQSQQLHARAKSQSPPRLVPQTKLPPRKMVMPPKSPQRELSGVVGQANSPAVARRVARPVMLAPTPKPGLNPLMKIESPKPRERPSCEQNEGTPKKQKQCNCKNSRCLKLYCECFASGVYCDGCNCLNCHNKMKYEDDRKESIDAILERNPSAFRPKIAGSPHGVSDGGVEHNKGCNCKKSGCLKKYCECFQANIMCSNKCKCMECKNFEGSEERKAHFHQYPAHSMVVIREAVNAAINGAIGTLKKKCRNKQIDFGVAPAKQLASHIPQSHQETCFPRASCSPLSVFLPKSLELRKSSYRSPLTGILHLQHVNDLCRLLVEVSAESAKRHSEERKKLNGVDLNKAEILVVSSDLQHRKDHRNQQTAMELCASQKYRDGTSLLESDDNGIQNGRPLSPGTLALMCDEHDMTFTGANTPSMVSDPNTRTIVNLSSTHSLNNLNVEQERLVLTRLCSFLNRLITCGSIEEMKVDEETK